MKKMVSVSGLDVGYGALIATALTVTALCVWLTW